MTGRALSLMVLHKHGSLGQVKYSLCARPLCTAGRQFVLCQRHHNRSTRKGVGPPLQSRHLVSESHRQDPDGTRRPCRPCYKTSQLKTQYWELSRLLHRHSACGKCLEAVGCIVRALRDAAKWLGREKVPEGPAGEVLEWTHGMAARECE